jgi:isopentenyldiphosphate isomerase
MTKQLLNVVDNTGNIIGEETRENVHGKGLLHREIHVLILDKDKKIVFQLRDKNKDTYPDLLDAAVGGHVELGDDFVTAAIKETEEETGIKVTESDLKLIRITKSRSQDSATGMTNNAMRAIYCYKFSGSVDQLKVESGSGCGFESYSLNYLENVGPNERKRFIQKMLGDEYMAIYREMIE